MWERMSRGWFSFCEILAWHCSETQPSKQTSGFLLFLFGFHIMIEKHPENIKQVLNSPDSTVIIMLGHSKQRQITVSERHWNPVRPWLPHWLWDKWTWHWCDFSFMLVQSHTFWGQSLCLVHVWKCKPWKANSCLQLLLTSVLRKDNRAWVIKNKFDVWIFSI